MMGIGEAPSKRGGGGGYDTTIPGSRVFVLYVCTVQLVKYRARIFTDRIRNELQLEM